MHLECWETKACQANGLIGKLQISYTITQSYEATLNTPRHVASIPHWLRAPWDLDGFFWGYQFPMPTLRADLLGNVIVFTLEVAWLYVS
jgi:hypothetical protein